MLLPACLGGLGAAGKVVKVTEKKKKSGSGAFYLVRMGRREQGEEQELGVGQDPAVTSAQK